MNRLIESGGTIFSAEGTKERKGKKFSLQEGGERRDAYRGKSRRHGKLSKFPVVPPRICFKGSFCLQQMWVVRASLRWRPKQNQSCVAAPVAKVNGGSSGRHC